MFTRLGSQSIDLWTARTSWHCLCWINGTRVCRARNIMVRISNMILPTAHRCHNLQRTIDISKVYRKVLSWNQSLWPFHCHHYWELAVGFSSAYHKASFWNQSLWPFHCRHYWELAVGISSAYHKAFFWNQSLWPFHCRHYWELAFVISSAYHKIFFENAVPVTRRL